jgi:GNAT superfamily N-acetyltransferase
MLIGRVPSMPYDRGIHRQVAEMHVACLDQGFLSSLGPAILTELYRAIDTNDDSVLIVEMKDSRVIGFVAGSTGMRPVYREMLARPIGMAKASLPLMLRPRKVWGILEILRHGRSRRTDSALPDNELLSIAVAPVARGSGVAERLYNKLVDHFRRQGVGAFRIVVGDQLAPAHRFYQKMGAQAAEKVEVHAGQGSTIYVQQL